jgi:hypothetical protein
MLAPDQRRVIGLLYLDGQSRPQVAAAMGRSVNAVRTLQRRGLRHLRQHLTGNQYPVGSPQPVGADPAQPHDPTQLAAASQGHNPTGWR